MICVISLFTLGLIFHAQIQTEQGTAFDKTVELKIKELSGIFQEKLKVLQERLLEVEKFMYMNTPPYTFTISDYRKTKENQSHFESPAVYTHRGGYKFQLSIYPDTHQDPYISVYVRLLKGNHDDVLKFPVKFTITLELLNQYRNRNHHMKNITCEATIDKISTTWSFNIFGFGIELMASAWYGDKPKTSYTEWIGEKEKFISDTQLKSNQDEQTQYLKEDSLRFRVTQILFHDNYLT